MSRARDLAYGTFSGAVAAASGDFTGTIEAADFSDGTLTVGTEYVTNGSAKAWVNFNGTGTIAARDSFNVASLTDNGTGDYTINYSNAMGNVNYICLGSQTYVTVNTDQYVPKVRSTADYLVGSIRVYGLSSGSTLFDYDMLNFGITGDLA
jgi:hypothetical protein